MEIPRTCLGGEKNGEKIEESNRSMYVLYIYIYICIYRFLNCEGFFFSFFFFLGFFFFFFFVYRWVLQRKMNLWDRKIGDDDETLSIIECGEREREGVSLSRAIKGNLL